jgi:hypothetical protein
MFASAASTSKDNIVTAKKVNGIRLADMFSTYREGRRWQRSLQIQFFAHSSRRCLQRFNAIWHFPAIRTKRCERLLLEKFFVRVVAKPSSTFESFNALGPRKLRASAKAFSAASQSWSSFDGVLIRTSQDVQPSRKAS